jgi:TP901 family phage tail tape measure protein
LEIFRLFGSILINNDEANNSISKTEGKADGLTKKLGEGIAAAAKWGLGLAAGAGIGLAAFMKAGEDLQDSLNKLQASTGSSDKEMQGMKTSLENIYKGNYGESFQDIADSMAMVKQNTGLAGKELENTTKNAIVLRDTFDMDVNETTNTANSLMKQFGITSEQAFNLIAQGAQNGANKNGDLLDSLNEYAPQFKSLGFSAEQFTNVLIDGAKNGQFSIDKVGDSVKEFNIRAKDGSKTTVDAFKSLGFNADKMGEKFAKGGETGAQAFQQVVQKLNEVKDPVEKNRIGVELFGTQFEDLQAKGISALANIGTNANMSKDALGEIDKVRYDSFGQALQGIGRQLMIGLFDPFNQKIMPIMNEFAQWITDHMPQIQSGITTAMDIASKAFDNLKNAVKWVIDNMNILLPIIGAVTGAILAQMIIDGLVKLYNAWKLATEAQTTAQWLLNAAMDANPIGLVALAIGVLIAAGIALYQNWDTVKNKMQVIWMEIKAGAQDAINAVIGKINDLIDGINKVVHTHIPKLKEVSLDVLSTVRAAPGTAPKGYGRAGGAVAAYASGTEYHPGGLAIVGEEGPELVNLPIGSSVKTSDETSKMLKGGNTINIYPQKAILDEDELNRMLWRIEVLYGQN